jgi:hypothetical protein
MMNAVVSWHVSAMPTRHTMASRVATRIKHKDYNTFIKCLHNQQTHFMCMMYSNLQYLHQRVSASNPTIFRVMFLIQEYKCS